MKDSLKLLFVVVFTIVFYSCQKREGYVITGHLTGFPDSTMFYLRNLNTDETFDSTLIINNIFRLEGQLMDGPEQIWLNTLLGQEFIYTNLLIGNEDVTIEGDITDFPLNVKVTGSKTQDDYNYLRDLTKAFDAKRDSLVQSYFKLTPKEQQEKAKEIWGVQIKELDDTIQALRIGYVKSNINTYTALINLGYLKESLAKDTVQDLFNRLNQDLKASKYAKIISVYLNEKISEVGDDYHDFKALANTGDTVRFSELTGKYVLLDFTSAYCGPCIQSAEELRIIDKTYSDSLDIISFSGDLKKETWLKSLSRDSVTWISLWDGQGTYSETYIKYGVSGFPTFFLIDPQGKIIDKWSGYGKGSLEYKLQRFKS